MRFSTLILALTTSAVLVHSAPSSKPEEVLTFTPREYAKLKEEAELNRLAWAEMKGVTLDPENWFHKFLNKADRSDLIDFQLSLPQQHASFLLDAPHVVIHDGREGTRDFGEDDYHTLKKMLAQGEFVHDYAGTFGECCILM